MYTTTAPVPAPAMAPMYYPSAAPLGAVAPVSYMDPSAAMGGSNALIPYQAPSAAYPVSNYVYQPAAMSAMVPSTSYAGPLIPAPAMLSSGSGALVPIVPVAKKWLYHSEEDHYAKHEEGYRRPPERKIMYTGALPRAMLSEAYMCGHLCHQMIAGTPAGLGEVLQLNSSTGKSSLLTVVHSSLETPDLAWRLLSDGYTSYLIFRGALEYQYAAHESRLALLHDILPKVSVKVHNLFLHQLVPQIKAIRDALDHQQARRLVIAGHGNGGAIATLCLLLLQRAGYSRKQVIVYTFGAPLVMCGSLKPDRPLPKEITHSVFNFVNEDDLVPCLLGNKDLHMVDLLLSSDPANENPYKTGRHTIADLLAYRPVGAYYHFTAMNTMVDIPADRARFFMNVNRGSASLGVRLAHHAIDAYVSKLRSVVTDN